MDIASKDILEFLHARGDQKLGEIRQQFSGIVNCPDLVQNLKESNLIDYAEPLTYLCTISINKYGISALNSLKDPKNLSEIEKENVRLKTRIQELEEEIKRLKIKP